MRTSRSKLAAALQRIAGRGAVRVESNYGLYARENFKEVSHFCFHFTGRIHRVGDFSAQQLAVTLAEAVDGHADRALGQVERHG